MSRNLPEELAPALARTGHAWPQADEDGLRRAAALWREFGSEADALVTRGAASAQRVSGENKGPAVEAFADHWRQFSGGGRGQLDDAAAAAALVAAALDKAAGVADQSKADIIAVLTELTEKIRAADAAEAKAKADIASAGQQMTTGLGGLVTGAVGAVVGAVKEVAAEAGELAAVEHAKVKIGQLLEQLGRDMGEAAKSLAKEPPLVALERIAQADGRGLHGERRETSMAARSGQVTGVLAKAGVAGAVEVASVAQVHADLKADGTVRTDRNGNPVLVGPDGQRVKGVENLTVTQGPDGTQQLVTKDGTPVSGVAMDEGGKPLLGSNGQPLLVGLSGALIGTGLMLALGHNGQPELGTDGHPVMTTLDGHPVAALVTDPKGHLLAGTDGQPVTVDASGRAVGPNGQIVQFGADGRPLDLLGADGKPVPVADGQQHGGGPFQNGHDNNGHGNGNGHGQGNQNGQGNDWQAGNQSGRGGGPLGGLLDPVTAPVETVVQGALGGDHPQPAPAPADNGGHRGGGGGGNQQGGYQNNSGNAYGNAHSSSGGSSYAGASSPAYQGGGGGGGGVPYPDDDYRPPARGPLSVHVDSVAAPPAPSAPPLVGGDIWSSVGGGGGGGHHAPDPGSSYAGSASSSGSSFQLGPVGGGGGGAVGGGLPAGGGGAVGGPVVGAGPVGGPVGAAPGGAAPVPGAPGAGGAAGPVTGPVGGPVGGGVGAPGAAGAPGGAAAVVGVGQHPVAGRPVATGPVAPIGGGGIGQHAPGGPVRGPYEPLGDLRRQSGTDEQGVPVHPGQASAAWLLIANGRRGGQLGPLPAAERERTLADSRPYGLPGGLGPVDPAHQAEAVRRTPVPAPDPMVGEWIEVLNGGGPAQSGRANNCVDVALSAVDTLGGVPTCAAPRLPDGPAGERGGRDRAELELGTRFLDLGDGADAHGRLGQALLAHGTGTRAVLLTVDGFGRSHTWNAVNHKGVLSYLDHQTGYAAATPLYPADHGLWAIAVDAADRPIDLTAPLPATVAVPAAAQAPAPEPEPEPALVGAPAGEAGEAGAGDAPDEPAPPRSRLTIHRTTTGSTSR
ncbi:MULTISPECIES: toxin glutamine deamidase domain-containing protein [Kitasatospora]|uniref:Uncharacterized protein n=1 Tax=Kitasatospora setae (strain ATCC 33774 / DSM 43861 / JCM 3304 / KCC A-0304 / NBRC 14216 / KM-6054) TaxID=452652 RepID=E4NDB8_KITSK|nr:toxin glutamine deamidase domain-containing protein [Kitasatospora setae]BAJ29199.1 hypothetical protein KSE_33910 [Kitasatospora setae KM-6054]